MSSVSIEPNKSVKFEVRMIPSANLRNGTEFKVAV
jgi:hypothetical protein